MKEYHSILVVDDEPRYVKAIQINLSASGFRVFTAYDGQTAIEIVADKDPDLILLDIRMPGLNGLEACRLIREFSTTPIIFLTALAEDADKVAGLDAGADDYITKPFSADELLARVRAALRRIDFTRHTPQVSPIFRSGNMKVDLARRRVFIEVREIKLTPTEYKVLVELISNAGRVVMPEHLLEKVWGPGYEGENRLIWQAIHRLRHKLEDTPSAPTYIQTRPGLGYIFVSAA